MFKQYNHVRIDNRQYKCRIKVYKILVNKKKYTICWIKRN